MVDTKGDEAVTYVYSDAGIASLMIMKSEDGLIYNQRYWYGEETNIKSYPQIHIDVLDLKV